MSHLAETTLVRANDDLGLAAAADGGDAGAPGPAGSVGTDAGSDRGRASDWARIAVASLSRTLLVAAVLLLGWAAAPSAFGWTSTTVVTGSMEPRIHPGDVVVARPLAREQLAVGQVLLVDDPDHEGRLRLHRYVSTTANGALVLRGDANPADDSSPVAAEAVHGAGFLRVPYVGLPGMWLREGRMLELALLVAATLALLAGTRLDRGLTARPDGADDTDGTADIADTGGDNDIDSDVRGDVGHASGQGFDDEAAARGSRGGRPAGGRRTARGSRCGQGTAAHRPARGSRRGQGQAGRRKVAGHAGAGGGAGDGSDTATGGQGAGSDATEGSRRPARTLVTTLGVVVALVVGLGAVVAAGPEAHAGYAGSSRNSANAFSAAAAYSCPSPTPADSPYFYYAFDEASGSSALDSSGNGRTGTLVGSPGRVAGSCSAGTSPALELYDGELVSTATALNAPSVMSMEITFTTTDVTGGRLMGFGSSRSATSATVDRQLYVSDDGRVVFGIYDKSLSGYRSVASSTGYADRSPHHVVATMSGSGMRLYVDGTLVGSDSKTSSAHSSAGYWRIGSDVIPSGSAHRPATPALEAVIDDAAVYTTALTAAQVSAHYAKR